LALAAKHVGGLIVFEREVGLNEYMEIGTRLDAQVSHELLESVFIAALADPRWRLGDSEPQSNCGALSLAVEHQPEPQKNLGHAPSRRPWRYRRNRCRGGGDLRAGRHGDSGGRGNVTENVDGAKLRSALQDLVK
jgi:hypothetical protein